MAQDFHNDFANYKIQKQKSTHHTCLRLHPDGWPVRRWAAGGPRGEGQDRQAQEQGTHGSMSLNLKKTHREREF